MKMRAAVLYEQGLPRPYTASVPLVVEDLDLDGPGEGELLVEIAAAGLCHSDLSTIEGIRPRPVPCVPIFSGAASSQQLPFRCLRRFRVSSAYNDTFLGT